MRTNNNVVMHVQIVYRQVCCVINADLEKVWIEHGPHDQLLYQALSLFLACYVIPLYMPALFDNLIAHQLQHSRLHLLKCFWQLSIRSWKLNSESVHAWPQTTGDLADVLPNLAQYRPCDGAHCPT